MQEIFLFTVGSELILLNEILTKPNFHFRNAKILYFTEKPWEKREVDCNRKHPKW